MLDVQGDLTVDLFLDLVFILGLQGQVHLVEEVLGMKSHFTIEPIINLEHLSRVFWVQAWENLFTFDWSSLFIILDDSPQIILAACVEKWQDCPKVLDAIIILKHGSVPRYGVHVCATS